MNIQEAWASAQKAGTEMYLSDRKVTARIVRGNGYAFVFFCLLMGALETYDKALESPSNADKRIGAESSPMSKAWEGIKGHIPFLGPDKVDQAWEFTFVHPTKESPPRRVHFTSYDEESTGGCSFRFSYRHKSETHRVVFDGKKIAPDTCVGSWFQGGYADKGTFTMRRHSPTLFRGETTSTHEREPIPFALMAK